MNGFKITTNDGWCEECNRPYEELVGYYAGEPTEEKLRKIARRLFSRLTDEQFEQIKFDPGIFYRAIRIVDGVTGRVTTTRDSEFYVEKIELKEI